MNQYLITFRSVTYAQPGERSLTRRGISCDVMRTPKWMEEQGCGYGLRLRTANIYKSLDALRQDGILWRKVYAYSRDGRAEELTL